MEKRVLPKYPIYIPSKGRADRCLTAQQLIKDGVPFHLVVEPQEVAVYESFFPKQSVLALPFSNRGSVIPARNWIKEHATRSGAERHWQLDDNTYRFYRVLSGKRIPCRAGLALRVCEDLADRYENVAIAGLNYDMFYVTTRHTVAPFFLNHHVYSCTLVLNRIPYQWRGAYNEDTDICLQALAGGWCTILLNAFLVKKKWTMSMKGGNTDELYKGDGRLKMARSLERLWPGVVTTKRRFRCPQHIVHNAWRDFDTKLKLKPGVDLSKLRPNEYGSQLVEVGAVKSERLKQLANGWRSKSQQRKERSK
jgi:hypothetical protein